VVTTLFLKGLELQGGKEATVGAILAMAATGYVLKFCLAVAVTPFIYAGHAVLRRGFGLVPLPPDQPTG
jgi:hypothetical protein